MAIVWTKKLNHLTIKRLTPFLITLIIGLVTLWGIESLSNLKTLKIDRQGIVLHSFPTTNSEVVTEIATNSSIEIIQEQTGWLKARYLGRIEGWLPKWLINNNQLKNDKEIAASFEEATAIYQKADSKSSIISTIPKDSLIPINYIEYNWAQVSYQGKPAFVNLNAVELINQEEAERILVETDSLDNSIDEKEEEKERLKDKLIMRKKEDYLLEKADNFSNIIYQTNYLQEFTRLDFIEYNAQESFYFVADQQGIKGYINSFSLSEPVYSIDHRSQPVNSKLQQATIMLDPGHGGEDPGTLSTDQKYSEKSFTYKIADVLKKTLEAFGATVILTNESDQFLDLTERVEISNQKQPDLFLSLHFDSSYDTQINGVRTYFYHLNDEEFAKTLHSGLITSGRPNLGVEYGNFQVLRENTVPSLLLELGYITNSEDLELMLTYDYHQNLADAITEGLSTYFDQVENQLEINNTPDR
ncbi:N-acetylmuramoyl-L-alanine amidase [Facklamia sp. 7083-14-GEN3]|uniref:N-acetylmuramoyl-L-alanine amidase n=1 Tax=Facklamia sp. 7083-14-GEN3 TaxID=2973478 RepID=UPI00215D0C90|nr:N-acetylmuramoyl-L-alanine amidase [Facklamia sp. 7083-14-GEN3]MCR8968681.1 N-acetylmuramoyl-L-alanine amidase [Facklamia sp. 7083-14-GEN3]